MKVLKRFKISSDYHRKTCRSLEWRAILSNCPFIFYLMDQLVQAGISEKWDLRSGTFGGTRDPRFKTHLVRETQNLKGGTQDPRFAT